MTREEFDKDMIESIEMWLHEIEPKWVEKELTWLDELRNRLLEEKSEIPNDLEEAAQQYAEGPECKWVGTTALEYAFIAGYNLCKEQMMKEAVEGEVSRYETIHYVKINESQLTARLKQFQPGDKVRVIVLPKEDEK